VPAGIQASFTPGFADSNTWPAFRTMRLFQSATEVRSFHPSLWKPVGVSMDHSQRRQASGPHTTTEALVFSQVATLIFINVSLPSLGRRMYSWPLTLKQFADAIMFFNNRSAPRNRAGLHRSACLESLRSVQGLAVLPGVAAKAAAGGIESVKNPNTLAHLLVLLLRETR
jgi:hypothetical protein